MAVGPNTKFFIGDEVEGKYKGLRTLFINGDQPVDRIKEILKANSDIRHVYFGANHQSTVMNLRPFMEDFVHMGYYVTYEIDYRNIDNLPWTILHNPNIHKMVTLKNIPNWVNVTLKVENKQGIFCYSEPIYNSWDEYKGDTEVE